MSVLILIPARMASTRLPGKPLADIGGRPMIIHVAERARRSGLGRVVIATDSAEIADAAHAYGHEAVMTDAKHQSGSDRVFEALQTLDPEGHIETVLNLQGDLPTIDPAVIQAALSPLEDPAVDIGTLGVAIVDEAEKTAPSVVKIVGSPLNETRLRTLYFTRATAPWGEGPLYHHVGIYAWRRAALARFVSLEQSTLEKRESLEQLRALEAGMRIDAEIVNSVPLGVDTPEDLERARALIESRNS